MSSLPLEDSYTDVLAKAMRGLGTTETQVAQKAGVTETDLAATLGGDVRPEVLAKVAPVLGLASIPLTALAQGKYRPAGETSIPGLRQFNTPYDDMTVNAYLVWDPASRAAAVFDTGASAEALLDTVTKEKLQVGTIFLTHTHPDHIAELPRLRRITNAPVRVSRPERQGQTEAFDDSALFHIGKLSVECRATPGHTPGGTTFVITGLAHPIAIVGDALFAGSMGGAATAWKDAIQVNRERILSLPPDTIICPGHGPMTTVADELSHNPIYA